MPTVIVPMKTPVSDSVGEPIPFGYEYTYWEANKDVYEYLSEAFDVDLFIRQAYLISDQPLKVSPLGYISDSADWMDTLSEQISKVRKNEGQPDLQSKILGFENQRVKSSLMAGLTPFSECLLAKGLHEYLTIFYSAPEDIYEA